MAAEVGMVGRQAAVAMAAGAAVPPQAGGVRQA